MFQIPISSSFLRNSDLAVKPSCWSGVVLGAVLFVGSTAIGDVRVLDLSTLKTAEPKSHLATQTRDNQSYLLLPPPPELVETPEVVPEAVRPEQLIDWRSDQWRSSTRSSERTTKTSNSGKIHIVEEASGTLTFQGVIDGSNESIESSSLSLGALNVGQLGIEEFVMPRSSEPRRFVPSVFEEGKAQSENGIEIRNLKAQGQTPQSSVPDDAAEIQITFEIPPQVDAVETAPAPPVDVSEVSSLAPVSGNALQGTGEAECLSDQCFQPSEACDSDCGDWLHRSILTTHRGLEAIHHCFDTPFGHRWIFWKDEYTHFEEDSCRCRLQERFVNWRLSSMELQGCMPEGYDLLYFATVVNQAEFHGTPLAVNGPIDAGGTREQAELIEGPASKAITQLSIDIAPPEGELPPDHAAEKFKELALQVHIPGTHRDWCGTSFYWNASLLNHQPLYFEDVNLERHGFSYGVWQPFVSGAKFFSRLPALPYLMAAQPPLETQFTLGETRPGNHANYVVTRPPVRFDAAAVEAAVVVGLVFLIP